MVAIYDAYSYVPGACGARDSFGTFSNWFEPVRTGARRFGTTTEHPNNINKSQNKYDRWNATVSAVGTLAGLAHTTLSLTTLTVHSPQPLQLGLGLGLGLGFGSAFAIG